MAPSLAQQVEALTQRLADTSAEPFYADPFWFARYGEERARRHTNEDGVFHVRYLVQALNVRNVKVMERYARWLQGVLVPRGMCSHHISEHFRELREALMREGMGDPLPHEYLRAAEAALDWPDDAARAVREATPRLVMHVLPALMEHEAVPAEQEARLGAELALQLSYLQDALGTKRPALFVDHARWYAGFWPQRGLRCDYTVLLGALETALAAEGSLPDSARETVAAGRAAAARGPV